MEPGGMFFDVSFQRYKALIDEAGYSLVAI
jgi:hypothetical protein